MEQMQYIFHFDIAAIILTMMLIFIIAMRKPFPSSQLKIYKAMLILNLISAASDLISAFTISFPHSVPLAVNYIVNVVYLSTHNVAAVLFLIYTIILIRGNLGKKYERILCNAAIAFDVIAVGTTPFTHWIFYFSEDLKYLHGPLMLALYASAFIILGYALYLLLFSRYTMSRFQMATNIMFLSLLITAVVFQYFFKNILIESFCAAIAFLMMNVALDNPAMYFHRDSSCYNQTAFATMITEKLRSETPFYVVAFTFDDLALFRKKFGDREFFYMLQVMIKRCHSLFNQKRVFLFSNNVFAIYLNGEDEKETINLLTKEFSKPYIMISGQTTDLTPHFCLVHHPGEAKSAADVSLVIEDMLFHTYRKTGLRVIWDTSKVLEKKHREDEIVHALHLAINNDGFEVFYQPIFNLKTGKFDTMEALLRFRDSTLKIYPDEFIPVAEQNGMILEIGAIVFQKVCEFWKQNRMEERGIEHINVNLSVLQLLRKSAVESLVKTAQAYGVAPCHINFEVTETATADETESSNVNDCITYLCNQGYSFSLDDYGSGYSNISYLAQMPFSTIKIDKQILWNAMKNQKDYLIILKSTLELVQSTGRKVVAEGVETKEMAELLKAMDCDFFQGFLYSKPLNNEDILNFISEKNQ